MKLVLVLMFIKFAGLYVDRVKEWHVWFGSKARGLPLSAARLPDPESADHRRQQTLQRPQGRDLPLPGGYLCLQRWFDQRQQAFVPGFVGRRFCACACGPVGHAGGGGRVLMPLGRLLHRPQGRTLLLFGQRQEKLSAEVRPWLWRADGECLEGVRVLKND